MINFLFIVINFRIQNKLLLHTGIVCFDSYKVFMKAILITNLNSKTKIIQNIVKCAILAS